jgi:hypothetical protein
MTRSASLRRRREVSAERQVAFTVYETGANAALGPVITLLTWIEPVWSWTPALTGSTRREAEAPNDAKAPKVFHARAVADGTVVGARWSVDVRLGELSVS